jgi:hypothetical protein
MRRNKQQINFTDPQLSLRNEILRKKFYENEERNKNERDITLS